MNNMRSIKIKAVLVAAIILLCCNLSGAVTFGPERIPYKVVYHFGMIHKVAGHGVVQVSARGNNFSGTLTGSSIPWGGRIYMVNDTLRARMVVDGSKKFSRQRVTYSNGWYSKPEVSIWKSGKFNRTAPANYRAIHGRGGLSASPATMEAITISTDMLGMFYTFKEMNFAAMHPGQTFNIPVTVPGQGLQHAVVSYLGPSTYMKHGVKTATYKVRFEYTYKGRRSNYPVTCQVDAATRIPLMLSADLAIGHMEMIYE